MIFGLKMEVLKVPMEKEEEKREELELCLELSIGGRYAKSENSMGKTENVSRDQNDNNNNFGAITRSDLSCDSVNDLQRRREIQALRRREARKKREEKLKKSRGQHGNFAFVEDRLFLEAQRIQARVLERDVRERDCCTEELTRKQDKINDCVNGVGNELHLCLYPKVQHPVSWGQNVALNCESEQCKGMNDGGSRKTVSFERSSSPVSEYQSTSQKGGNSSDAGSHSSPPCSRQYQSIPKREADHPVSNDSSSHIEPFTKNSNLNPHFNQTNNNTCPTSDNPTASAPSGVGPIEKPPKPPNHNNLNINAVTPVPHMPRVSATGNGPNGKTINGFLYKYTKTEVSIVCVCHGTSFSPAEFVEHAGGVDVSHPLRHITIIPSAFG